MSVSVIRLLSVTLVSGIAKIFSVQRIAERSTSRMSLSQASITSESSMTDLMSMPGVAQRNATWSMCLAETKSVLVMRFTNIGSFAKLIARGKVKMVIVG